MFVVVYASGGDVGVVGWVVVCVTVVVGNRYNVAVCGSVFVGVEEFVIVLVVKEGKGGSEAMFVGGVDVGGS